AESGDFLPDLANRLTSLVITIPPLRERREDIAPMVEYFVREYSAAHEMPTPVVTPEAMRILESEPWPSNVRGLASVIENAVFRSTGGSIDASIVLQALGRSVPAETFAVERERLTALSPDLRKSEAVIRKALEVSDWNGKAAAQI